MDANNGQADPPQRDDFRSSPLWRYCKSDGAYFQAKADYARRERDRAAHYRAVAFEAEVRELAAAQGPRDDSQVGRLIRLVETLLQQQAAAAAKPKFDFLRDPDFLDKFADWFLANEEAMKPILRLVASKRRVQADPESPPPP